MKTKFVILTPVYNDWKNLDKLLIKINKIFLNEIKQKFDLIVIDDHSSEKSSLRKSKFTSIKNLKVLRNQRNLGSQRSIAIGIKYLKKYYKGNTNIIVIDSDGQDNPTGIKNLIKKFDQNNTCVVAERGQRKESLWFKFFYEIYCLVILIFAFKRIRYGNFSLLKLNSLKDILKDHNIWSAFPPSISLNLNKISSITLDRDKRYSGNSKMNFFGLFYHALRVFAVLRKRIFISSTAYFTILYLFFYKINTTLVLLVLFFLCILNISNFILCFNNEKKFKKNFSKIKIYTPSTY